MKRLGDPEDREGSLSVSLWYGGGSSQIQMDQQDPKVFGR